MNSIYTLLQQKAPIQVVRQILENAGSNWRNVDISIFQFFIDAFGKDFDFTEDMYSDIIDLSVDLESFVMEIYEADDTVDEWMDLKLKEFMSNLISEALIREYLTESTISNWVTFLATVAEHMDIPTKTKMKQAAYLLLTFMLAPLTTLMELFDNPDMDLNESLQMAVTHSVERIFNNISESFKFLNCSTICAKEFSDVLINRHQILLQNVTYLINYRVMLMYDHRPLISLALKSIQDLCRVESLKDVMKEFLFSTENDEESVVELIVKLINFKNLKHEVLGCLKQIAKIYNNNEIATSNSYNELFLNLLTKSRKTVAETAELMLTLEVDFWFELVKILNFYTHDDDVDIKFILTSINGIIETDLQQLLDFIVLHINEPIISRRAAEIFNVAFDISSTKEQTIASLINTIEQCKTDEMTFILLLQTFIGIDDEMFVTFLRKENVSYLTRHIIPIVSNAFLDYNKSNSLSTIVAALKKLYAIEPVSSLTRIRDITNGFYRVLMNTENVEFTEREKLVPKLSALFECKSWRLVDDAAMVNLYNFCQKFCTNIHYNYFAKFQRFYVNLLKHFWMFLATNRPLLIEDEKFIKDTKNIHAQIQNALKITKNSISDNCLLLCSLIDLYMLFQPKMSEKLGNEFFTRFNIQLSKEDFIRMVDLMEVNLFPETEDFGFYQQMLMQNFTVMYKNYINLPSVTSSHVFLRNYSVKSLYKAEIETLLTTAIVMKRTIFEKSVAFAILNIATTPNMERFRAFYNALDEFMRKKIGDLKLRNVSYGLICSIVLERCSRQITADAVDEDDRLVVLEYLGIIIKNSDQSFSKNLLKFIKINENFLTQTEMRKLSEFKRMLNEN